MGFLSKGNPRYALAEPNHRQKEDWQNFYHWYFFIQKPLKFKDGTFKEGFIETSFDTYLKKNEIGSSQVRLFVKRVTNLFNFICDKCCIRYHTYRVRYEDHGIFKYLNRPLLDHSGK